MPRFFISVASPFFPQMKFEYKGQSYAQRTTEQFDFPSLHIMGAKDPHRHKNTTLDILFTKQSNPKLIFHDEGHVFPRALKDRDFKVLKEFSREQYVHKFGSDEGFKCDWDHFDFRRK